MGQLAGILLSRLPDMHAAPQNGIEQGCWHAKHAFLPEKFRVLIACIEQLKISN